MNKTDKIGLDVQVKTKLIIIENDETWRFLYKQSLQKLMEVKIVGEFERAEIALQKIDQLCPDIALVDISLPGMSGLEFAEKMQEYPNVRIILITSHYREYLSKINPNGFLVIDKGNTKEILDNIKAAVLKI
jgi:two-component SAPR family response regulator